MPHIVVEYTANTDKRVDFSALFKSLHETLADILGIDINLFQSRAIASDPYLVGDNLELASVYVTLSLLEGRPGNLRMRVKNTIMSEIKNYLSSIQHNISYQVSIEIRDIIKQDYIKEIVK